MNRAHSAMAEIQGDETAKVSHLVYPLMQTLDIEYLDLDLAVGGLDQRKVHMLAREKLPELEYDVRPAIPRPSSPTLPAARGRCPRARGSVSRWRTRPRTSRRRSIRPSARRPAIPKATSRTPSSNCSSTTSSRASRKSSSSDPEKYGGDLTYEAYEDLAADLESGELHPADAKGTLAASLDELIAPAARSCANCAPETDASLGRTPARYFAAPRGDDPAD